MDQQILVMGVPSHLVTIRGQMVLGHLVPSYFSNVGILNLGGMTKSGTKHSSMGSTLLRSFIPSITFSFLSKRLHLCCTLICSDRLSRFFRNFSCSQRSFEFGTANWSSLFFEDTSLSCEPGSSVIPFPFVKSRHYFCHLGNLFLHILLHLFNLFHSHGPLICHVRLMILGSFLTLYFQIPCNVQAPASQDY